MSLFNQDFEDLPKKFGQAKGSVRIQINNVLSAICIALIAILTNNKIANSAIYSNIFSELAIAIPCLVTSSLLYSKICYRPEDEYALWNGWAWFTHTIGYFLILNVLFLILNFNDFHIAAYLLFISTVVLILIYSIIDIMATKNTLNRKDRIKEKFIKLVVYLGIMYFGAIRLS